MKEGHIVLKISDFGLSKDFVVSMNNLAVPSTNVNELTAPVGTPKYMSPEMHHLKFGKSEDSDQPQGNFSSKFVNCKEINSS